MESSSTSSMLFSSRRSELRRQPPLCPVLSGGISGDSSSIMSAQLGVVCLGWDVVAHCVETVGRHGSGLLATATLSLLSKILSGIVVQCRQDRGSASDAFVCLTAIQAIRMG